MKERRRSKVVISDHHSRSNSMAADRSKGVVRDEFATYAYILLYIALSSGQIFFNKVLTVLTSISKPGSVFSSSYIVLMLFRIVI